MSNKTENSLTPKLRFPEFQGTREWEGKTLREVCLRITNGKANAEDHEEDGIYPLFDRSAVIKRSSTFMFDSEAVILPGEGMRFVPKYFSGKFNLHQRAYALMEHQGDARFVYYSLDWLKDLLAKKAVKSTVLSLRLPIVENFPISWPKSSEQQKIADCLSSLDELIAAQARKVDALKIHKKGLMQQLFPREGETQPRLRFPEFRNAREWEITTVGGLVEAGWLFPPKDGNHGNIHPKSSDYVASGIPFIMASDLKGGLIDIKNCHFISKNQADKLQKGFAKEGDVLLSHKGTVGEIALVRQINTPYLMLTPQVTYYRVKDQQRMS